MPTLANGMPRATLPNIYESWTPRIYRDMAADVFITMDGYVDFEALLSGSDEQVRDILVGNDEC